MIYMEGSASCTPVLYYGSAMLARMYRSARGVHSMYCITDRRCVSCLTVSNMFVGTESRIGRVVEAGICQVSDLTPLARPPCDA